MTSAFQDANDKTNRNVLEVAVKLGIKYYRMNWFSYPEEKAIRRRSLTWEKEFWE
jgi:hypothetical protein